MEYYYIVAAAGVGKRMELKYPKQFLEVEGKPIFIKTLEVIEKNKEVKGIIVVTNNEYKEKVRKICSDFKITKLIEVVSGGKERQDSIYNALLKIPDNIIVGVQDGVRPFIKDSYIKESYSKLMGNPNIDGIVVGVPVKDTIKIIGEDKQIIKTPKRSNLFAAQTPQVFRSNILKKAYKEAKETNYQGTDDASLVEKINGIIETIVGSYENIKITTPEDLIFLKK